jgi:hypothetical protein
VDRTLSFEEGETLADLVTAGEEWLVARAWGRDTTAQHVRFETALTDFRRAERKSRRSEKKAAKLET